MATQKPHEELIEFLNKMDLDELSYTLGRYCGRHNTSLCEKKFGFIIPKETAQKVYDQRILEHYLLGDSQ